VRDKLVALMVALLFVVAAVPLGSQHSQISHSAATTAGSNVLVIGDTTAPDTTDLNPIKIITTYYMAETYSSMIGWDSQGNLVPLLAQSWSVSASGLNYTFNLRPNLEWSDGQPLNSSDVAFTFNLITEQSPLWYYLFSAIQVPNSSTVTGESLAPGSITTPNATQIDFNLLTPASTFLIYAGGQPIYPEHYYASQNLTANNPNLSTMVGSGPFIPTSYTPGTELDMTANPHYFGGAPHLSGVIFKYFTTSASAEIALESGAIDLLQGVPPPDVSTVAKTPGIVIGTEEDQSNIYLIFNMYPELADNTTNPVSNILVREAIAYALDLPGILNASFGSSQYYKLANQIEVPNMYYNGGPIQNTTIPNPAYPQNVTYAESLLKLAGYPNGFTLSLIYPSGGIASAGTAVTLKMVQLMQSELSQLGITLNLISDDSTDYNNVVFNANPPKTWNLVLSVISESPDGDVAPFYMVSSLGGNSGAGGFNAGGYNVTAFNNLVLEEENTTGAGRVALFQQIDGYIYQQLPVLEIYYEIQIVAWSNQFQGFELGLGNPWHDYWGSLKMQSLANVSYVGSATSTTSSSSSSPSTTSSSSSSMTTSSSMVTSSLVTSTSTSTSMTTSVVTSTSSITSTSSTTSSSSSTLLIAGAIVVVIIVIAAVAALMMRRRPGGSGPAASNPTT
jgi:ABC-type transport system substrate-binding protein